MPVNFERIKVGIKYSRPELATLWGYKGFQAISRGVVTPKDTNFIILFVTEQKQSYQEQYDDRLEGNLLKWEGPTDHFAETRMVESSQSVDQIHVFHRAKHHSDFTYLGEAVVENYKLFTNKPSEFTFNIAN